MTSVIENFDADFVAVSIPNNTDIDDDKCDMGSNEDYFDLPPIPMSSEIMRKINNGIEPIENYGDFVNNETFVCWEGNAPVITEIFTVNERLNWVLEQMAKYPCDFMSRPRCCVCGLKNEKEKTRIVPSDPDDRLVCIDCIRALNKAYKLNIII